MKDVPREYGIESVRSYPIGARGSKAIAIGSWASLDGIGFDKLTPNGTAPILALYSRSG